MTISEQDYRCMLNRDTLANVGATAPVLFTIGCSLQGYDHMFGLNATTQLNSADRKMLVHAISIYFM